MPYYNFLSNCKGIYLRYITARFLRNPLERKEQEMEEEREYVELTGILDVSTELCIDGSEALALVTDDGDEYVINNRKTVKRLFKYAYNMSRLICTGYLEHDPTGIDILSVVSFVEDEMPQEKNKAAKTKKAPAKKTAEKKSSKKKTEEKQPEPAKKSTTKKAVAKKKETANKPTSKKTLKKSARSAFEESFDEYDDDDVSDFVDAEEQEF